MQHSWHPLGNFTSTPTKQGWERLEQWISPREYLSGFNKGFCHTSVPATVARCDEVSHSTALQESGSRHLAFAKDPGKGNHLHQAKANNSSFGIITTAKAIAETSSYCHYILRRRGKKSMGMSQLLPTAS